MTIQVPWKMRLRGGHQAGSRLGGWWSRKKFRADPKSTNSTQILHEEDLDHLGRLHKSSH